MTTLVTATISGSVVDPAQAGISDVRKAKLTVRPSTVGYLITYAGGLTVGAKQVTIATDGTASEDFPTTDQTGIEPADWKWEAILWTPGGEHHAFFTLTADTTWGDLPWDTSTADVTPSMVTQANTAKNDAVAAKVAAQAAADSAAGSVSLTAWAASTTYSAGDIRQSPDGLPISRIAAGTSGTSWDATEKANWTPAVEPLNFVSIDLCSPPYSVSPDDDISTELQDAIDAIATSKTSGEVWFSKSGTYLVSGDLQTGTVTGTSPTTDYTYNGQILFPAVTQASGKPLGITIRGGAIPYKGGTVNKAGGVILRTNLTSGWMFDAIPAYSAYDAQYPWTNVTPIFKDIVLESASTDPQHGMIQAITCQSFKADNLLLSCLGVPSTTGSGTVEALSLPQVQNDGDVTLENTTIRGFGIGLRITEHLEMSSTRIGFCGTAFVSNGSGHANKFVRANVENCPTVFKCETIINSPVTVEGHLDWESSAVTSVAFFDYASGFSSMRGSLDVFFGYPSGGLPLKTGTTTTDDGSLWRDFNLRNVGMDARSSLDQHPSDDFTRAFTPMSTGAPGLTWPTLHRWMVGKGSFTITGTAQSPAALSSTNSTSESRALVKARNGGEPRQINTKFVLGTDYHVQQRVNYIHSTGNAFNCLAVDLTGGELKLEAIGSVPGGTLATVDVDAVADETHTIGTRVLNGSAGTPSFVTVFFDDVKVIEYQLSSSQSSALGSGIVFDGLSFFEENSTCTKFWVVPASPDPAGVAFGYPYTIDPALVRTLDALSINTANQGVFMRVVEGGMISKIGLMVVNKSGNISVAAYANSGSGRSAAPGTLLASSGEVACPAAGYQEVDLGSTVIVKPGDWLALSADNTTATFKSLLSGPGDSDLGSGRQYRQASAHPLPTTPASLTATIGYTYVLVGVA